MVVIQNIAKVFIFNCNDTHYTKDYRYNFNTKELIGLIEEEPIDILKRDIEISFYLILE